MRKTILFVSALDFKETSTLVIRKTPSHFASAGWKVVYLIARDDSRHGNFYYEGVQNLPGVEVHRVRVPFAQLHDRFRPGGVAKVFGRLRYLWSILRLAREAYRLAKDVSPDILYGVEIHGVLAVRLLRIVCRYRRKPFVSRFFGTILSDFASGYSLRQAVRYGEHVLALRTRADLCVMTDDGTRGDRVLACLAPAVQNVRFWTNGVDLLRLTKEQCAERRQCMGISASTILIVSICRLERWKRVDRSLRIIALLRRLLSDRDLSYIVIGDGTERADLESLAGSLSISSIVHFLGATPNDVAKDYLNIADVFLSMNDLSNVGNPLLEAVRAHKVIVTLDNGDTGRWITHRESGLIYRPDEDVPERASVDLAGLFQDSHLRERIERGIEAVEETRLWTWDERLRAEVEAIDALLGAG